MSQYNPLNLPDETSEAKACFGSYDTQWFDEMLKKAEDVGITGRNTNTKWEKYFDDMFFNGKPITYHDSWDENYLNIALKQFEAVGSSFRPKHQDKKAVCAYMLKILEEGPPKVN